MSGEKNGVQKYIMDKYPTAVYVHCASHTLNLCFTKATDVKDICTAVSLMHNTEVFYSDSAKRLQNLQEFIDKNSSESSRTRLKKYCATRWVKKQNAILTFKELYPAVLASLECISEWSGESGNKASIFNKTLDGAFLVALKILHSVLEVSNSAFNLRQNIIIIIYNYYYYYYYYSLLL